LGILPKLVRCLNSTNCAEFTYPATADSRVGKFRAVDWFEEQDAVKALFLQFEARFVPNGSHELATGAPTTAILRTAVSDWEGVFGN
jgi:hypothetical protein